ncbi:hypothetical protein EMIT0196P_20331 [Pseudomonas chlororaphis]
MSGFFAAVPLATGSDHRQSLLAQWRGEGLVDGRQVFVIQAQPGRLGVQPDVLGVHRLGNGDHAFLAQDPGQGNLGRGHAMAFGDLLQRGVAQQLAGLGDRAVSHERQALLLRGGQQVEFDAAFLDVVQHLVGGAGRARQFLEVVEVEIGNAPAADLAVFAQALEGFHRFFKRVLATPVQQVQIDIVGPQAPQAAVAGLGNAFAAGVVRVHLADQEHPVALAGDGGANHFLRAALGIHLGGIDQTQAPFDTGLQCGNLGVALVALLAHAPGTLANHRDGHARQIECSHGNLLKGLARTQRSKGKGAGQGNEVREATFHIRLRNKITTIYSF